MSSGQPLPSSFDGNSEFYEESRWQKLRRRIIEEPLIPLGCALTVWALFGASTAIRAGNSHRANTMFRRRIYAQGFTLIAMLAGSVYWSKDRDKRKEFEGMVAERKRQDKHQAWLRELEARDVEEKMFRARLERARERHRQGDFSEEPQERVDQGREGPQGAVESVVEEAKEKGAGVLRTVRESIGKT
ncbi:Respiratory supercomplex factor 1, mitochondrial [Coniosporium apollinis]|uniref:Respiratory supercomplex factor 1, mitochondrial n=1 Tax=Coniosporium apollinis TaxID=61459 RepID=A0ABQ9NIG1_9PEZI|nr:Respiratory supercomplex factor 1, mitochondrial [Coniosporium apollinis]